MGVNKDLANMFRESRGQCLEPYVETKKSYNPSKKGTKDRYTKFLEKYENLEEHIDNFNTHDLMYFYSEKAEENGVKYVTANVQRDLGALKLLKERYSVREACLMIEFLFTSNQNYLRKEGTAPTVLISGWGNKIYHDSLLWAEDKYKPEVSFVEKREWEEETTSDKVNIGEW